MTKYWNKLSKENKNLISQSILKFKKYLNDQYSFFLILIYFLYFFNIIKINNKYLTETDKIKLKILVDCFKYEINWEKEKFLENILGMDKNLFLIKIVMKYTFLNQAELFDNYISKKVNYYKSIWYLIPYLTLKESKLLWFFQDVYFKKVYPIKYFEIKRIHFEQLNKIELPWEYLIWVIDDLVEIMEKAKVYWILKLRKKSYFSMFNKFERKNYKNVSDFIWVRIIFTSKKDLKSFVSWFENYHVFIDKKDYIKIPKVNWYRSIHYKYLTTFKFNEILVELQLRTKQMDKKINSIAKISHFNYTIKEKKWSNIFKEVHFWHEFMMDYFKNNNN